MTQVSKVTGQKTVWPSNIPTNDWTEVSSGLHVAMMASNVMVLWYGIVGSNLVICSFKPQRYQYEWIAIDT